MMDENPLPPPVNRRRKRIYNGNYGVDGNFAVFDTGMAFSAAAFTVIRQFVIWIKGYFRPSFFNCSTYFSPPIFPQLVWR
jgi:hypothetical protein